MAANNYFEFGCDFNIFLQSLDARSKTKKEQFKIAETWLCTGHGWPMTESEFERLYGEYAQVQINSYDDGKQYELMITFPKLALKQGETSDDFLYYASFNIEDYDEMKAIVNKCFELTVKNI